MSVRIGISLEFFFEADELILSFGGMHFDAAQKFLHQSSSVLFQLLLGRRYGKDTEKVRKKIRKKYGKGTGKVWERFGKSIEKVLKRGSQSNTVTVLTAEAEGPGRTYVSIYTHYTYIYVYIYHI